ncbi:uncharacterized protein G2W53_036893 [Senna tora]|uniref:Replication protein A 70 kDa DNA-binding subunit B/D first OB fold domain-containing protein n=1 Tax=Senna tora TaxID=362788 RepID=A0A834SWP7_9FABA|nr:uncharacterized protein G2W53_036893 [Senna tora]
MRTHTGGREILRPAPTHFATNFVALQSILAQKDALRAMITCREWTTSSFARESKSKKFVDAVLDSAFHNAREEMIKRFRRRKRVIEPYLKIIDRRWDKQLYKNLHATGFSFNPRYHYDTNEMEKHKIAISGVLDVIERYAHNDRALEEKLNEEVIIFRNAKGDFGKRLAGKQLRKRPYDPISFENFEENADWVLEDEPPTLTMEEIEALNCELAECTIEENHPNIGLLKIRCRFCDMMMHVGNGTCLYFIGFYLSNKKMQHNFDAIRSIDPFRFNWTIKARIVRLLNLPPYPKNSQNNAMEMVLCDREGSKISAYVKSTFTLKYMRVLKEGSVYIMSQFNVGSNGSGFRAVNHKYKLNFQFSTRVAETEDDDTIHRYGMSLAFDFQFSTS